MLEQAMAKIDEELKSFKGGRHASAVKNSVANALKEFAREDAEFAQAVVQADKTLSDCCGEIMKNAGDSISDLEVYRRAVRYYFPGADVEFHMSIRLYDGDQANPKRCSGLKILDLTDFL